MFFPDTYVFAKGSSDLAVLGRARRVMKNQLESAWAGRAPDLPMTDPYEALILASLVEKETGRAGDRTMIAAVFANRLRLRMKLQTDPSVIYGMGEQFDGNLRKRDLPDGHALQHLYAAWPSAASDRDAGTPSLAAVMHPAQTDALYFVSRGDGTSEFSAHPHRAQPRGRQVSNPRRPAAGKPMTRGKLITLEGIDGAGKSTHVEGIADFLRRRGKDIAVTREPGGTPLGEKLRELVSRNRWTSNGSPGWCSPRAASTSHRSSPRHSRRAAG